MQDKSDGTKLTTSEFDVQWVFGNLTESLRKNIVAFWMREGALVSRDEAWRRSWEVASVLLESESGNVAGVTSSLPFVAFGSRVFGKTNPYQKDVLP
jgi:hypothetical protein